MVARRIESNEMVHHILSSTQLLIAREGLQNLSMRNIAKEAGIASGTLYLYFKTKDDLLQRLAEQIYQQYLSAMEFELDPNAELFSQYRYLVLQKWAFLNSNPMLGKNLNQYQAMLGFDDIIKREINDENSIWNRLMNLGKSRGEICELPNPLLYVMSLDSIAGVIYLQGLNPMTDFERYLEEIILRTWKAIAL